MQDGADKHRAVAAAADDLQAVVAELNASHPVRVPPQRALLRMAQPRTSHQCTQQQMAQRCQNTIITSWPLVLSQILTVLSQEALAMCLPSGEYATEVRIPECPRSVHFSSPLCASQILTVLSFDPLTMCLPSGKYATEITFSECPRSVHSCQKSHPPHVKISARNSK
jgi:hypothetical protein